MKAVLIGIGGVIVGAIGGYVVATSMSPASGTTSGVEGAEINLESDEDIVVYSTVYQLADEINNSDLGVRDDVFRRAISDALNGEEPVVSEIEVRDAYQRFQRAQQEKIQEEQAAQLEENLAAENAFFEEKQNEDGVEFTESGLAYKVLTAGDGPQPTASDTVRVHYKGTLLDGTVFDSSYDRGQPATFGVGQVIPGWTEALQLMKVGSKYELYIPHDLAYGVQGRPSIPPGATLVFEVELLGIEGEE